MHTARFSLPSLCLALGILVQFANAQDTTLDAVSEYPDGQPQAPPATASLPATDSSYSPSMEVSTTETLSPSTSSYENPFTIYTSMTNSLGIITGMPPVETSQPTQPAVVTSQPPSATLPSYSGYYYNTTSSASVPPESPTTLATSTVAASESSNNEVPTTASSSNSAPTFAQVTGGAASNKLASAGISLIVAALGFCML